jgi:hypothetical protein
MLPKKLLLVAMCGLMLAGCASNVLLQRSQAAQITAESSLADVDRVLGQATVSADYEFESSGKRYRARHYALQTGTQQQSTVVCTPACIPIFYDVPVTDSYVVVHEVGAGRLHAWGSLQELSKSSDDSVSAIMPALKKEHEAYLARQKKAG